MVAAAVAVTAGMTFAVVVVIAAGMTFTVVTAADVGIEFEFSIDEGVDRVIGKTSAAAEEFDACLAQGILGAAADAAADEGIDIIVEEEAGQSAVSLSHGIDDEFFYDGAVFDVINFEL